jgi:MFS family permease
MIDSSSSLLLHSLRHWAWPLEVSAASMQPPGSMHARARADSARAQPGRLDWVQGLVVSAAVAGAAVGSAAGGVLSDVCGRKRALLAGDGLFAAGALAMAAAQHVSMLVAGGVFQLYRIGLKPSKAARRVAALLQLRMWASWHAQRQDCASHPGAACMR